MNMTDLEIHAKTDRELLVMACMQLNDVCKKVVKLDKAVHGNGKIGIKTQVYILWGIFIVGGGMVAVTYIKGLL